MRIPNRDLIRTPHALEFAEEERGNTGQWSEILSAVVP
jgi:hypothetical protein